MNSRTNQTNQSNNNNSTLGYFSHERLEVYQVARAVVRGLTARRGSFSGVSWLHTQAARAAGSVVLNVGEGAAYRAQGAKKRHYAIAAASCSEVASALDLASDLGITGLEEVDALNRSVARMLNRLSR